METFFREHPQIIAEQSQYDLIDIYPKNDLTFRLYQPPDTLEKMQQEVDFLNWNGIDRKTNGIRFIKRKYRLYIFQYECLLILQSYRLNTTAPPPILIQQEEKQLKWREIPSHSTATSEIMKIRQIAVRTLYVLGYDLGVVDICVCHSYPRCVVTKISPTFPSNFNIQKNIIELIKRNNQEHGTHSSTHTTKKITLGTDAEFVLRNMQGKYVMASNYVSKSGNVGYDAIWVRGYRGHHPIVELRPLPSEDPKQLFANLYQCMQKAIRQINEPQIEWLAGGRPLKDYPIGGHLHFSNVFLCPRLIRALDNYLTLPLFMLESDVSLQRRPKYGYIGDFREQFHGGFEYRTPPSWIVSPKIAKGVLILAKIIATHYYDLEWMPLNLYNVQFAFYKGKREHIRPIALQLWQELQTCNLYQYYEKDMQSFFNLVFKEERWDEYADIRKPWHLPPYND